MPVRMGERNDHDANLRNGHDDTPRGGHEACTAPTFPEEKSLRCQSERNGVRSDGLSENLGKAASQKLMAAD